MPGDILDLEPVTQIIEQLNGGEVAMEAEYFVRDVVAEFDIEKPSILPHVNVFYGIISSRTANKYIAMEWS